MSQTFKISWQNTSELCYIHSVTIPKSLNQIYVWTGRFWETCCKTTWRFDTALKFRAVTKFLVTCRHTLQACSKFMYFMGEFYRQQAISSITTKENQSYSATALQVVLFLKPKTCCDWGEASKIQCSLWKALFSHCFQPFVQLSD